MAEEQLRDDLDLLLQRGVPVEDSDAVTPPNGDEDQDYDQDDNEGMNEESANENSTTAHNYSGTLDDDGIKESDNDSSNGVPLLGDEENLDGSVQGRATQPVVTQQIIMDLIMNHPQPISQPSPLAKGGWLGRKEDGLQQVVGWL